MENVHIKYFSRAAKIHKHKSSSEILQLEKKKLKLEVDLLELKKQKLQLEVDKMKADMG